MRYNRRGGNFKRRFKGGKRRGKVSYRTPFSGRGGILR